MFKVFVLTFFLCATTAQAEEPVRYVGPDKTSNSSYADGYHDGQMRPAIGTQNTQILRANRTHPEWSDGLGWTYNHAPMLAHANNQFYCQYLANPTGEHVPPGVTLITRSQDGKYWTRPEVLFPIYALAKDADSFEYTVMHQRMGFYLAPNGRFLTMAFYGVNDGYGIGRVVREIYPDDSLGPIYFIRVNDNWQGQVHYPLYTKSSDAGFVEACQSFLNDKVRRMQWWEEDRFCQDKDDFYRVPWIGNPENKTPGKAFCFYTRPDKTVVSFFKSRWVTTTLDQGETWTDPVFCESITYGGAKVWAQALDNGQYALVYNPTNTPARHPLSVAISHDGVNFDGLANVHSELPVKRFWGREKRPGAQYVRGIIEGNGNPPGDDLHVVYSVNKEDIWISRVPVPVRRTVTGPVVDDFSTMATGGVVRHWNIYSPQWCPIEVVNFPSATEKSLQIKDFDPYDYAKAVRVFQPADRQSLSFDLFVDSSPRALDIEVVSAKGERLVQSRLDPSGQYFVKNGLQDYQAVGLLTPKTWVTLKIELNAQTRHFSLQLNGKPLIENAGFSAREGSPERIVFRTGPYRLTDDVQKYKSGDVSKPGWDEPGADEKVLAAVYYVKDFKATASEPLVLTPQDFKHHVDRFNSMEDEPVVNAISNAQAWSWMQANVPLFDCPDKDLEEIYYYRWWTFRKHIKDTPDGRVLTEFITPVNHAGRYNTVSCALGHHLTEGRWLQDQGLLNEYVLFWLRGKDGGPQSHLHKFSSWLPAALYNRYLVNHDARFLMDLLPDLVKDYQQWEAEKQLPNGLFWQYDVKDGMEESISGGRRVKNIRPTINSYMIANARAIAAIANMAVQPDVARTYGEKAEALKELMLKALWDNDAQFFKVQFENGQLSDAREAIGYIPWMFNIPSHRHASAWRQILDAQGFAAPYGLTTAEQRHPQFRTHGTGTCEWDGAIWPFATSQTLVGLANALRSTGLSVVSKQDYFDALLTYARAQHRNGTPYIGEYQDEQTGAWLKGDSPRSRTYNHSTFCDLIISGLVGLCAQSDDTVVFDTLIPTATWDWFALEPIPYHGQTLSILWDRTGEKYHKGKGFSVFVDGQLAVQSPTLGRVKGSLVGSKAARSQPGSPTGS